MLIPVMNNSNKSTIIDNRQCIESTNRDNVHNPAIILVFDKSCCKPAMVTMLSNQLYDENSS